MPAERLYRVSGGENALHVGVVSEVLLKALRMLTGEWATGQRLPTSQSRVRKTLFNVQRKKMCTGNLFTQFNGRPLSVPNVLPFTRQPVMVLTLPHVLLCTTVQT